jgi:hypothetical protein
LRIGIGEKIVLDAFHPDANALMAHCFNLELVCKQLATPGACFIHKVMLFSHEHTLTWVSSRGGME